MKKCSLIIPLYNENENIPYIIKNATAFLKEGHELILVNNGSTDKSKKTLKKFEKFKNIILLNIDKNEGFGSGVHQGIQLSNNSIVAYTHGDLQCDINDVIRGLKMINSSICLVKGERVGRSKIDKFFTLLMGYLCTFIFNKKLYDIHAQPNIFDKKLLDFMNHPPSDFSYDTYIYLLSLKKSIKIMRFKTNFKLRIHGKGNNDKLFQKILNSFKELKSIIRLKFNHDIYS